MEKNVIGPIRIDGKYIPKAAKGVHKIEKVMLFKSYRVAYCGGYPETAYVELWDIEKGGATKTYKFRGYERPANTIERQATYGVLLLDNGVLIKVMPGFGDPYSGDFSRIGEILLLSEGETVEFIEVMG